MENTPIENTKKPVSKKLIALIASIVAVVLIIAGGVWASSVKRAQAVEACVHANTAYSAAYVAYEKVVKTATSTLETTPANQVADTKTREALESLAKTSVKKTPAAACDVNLISAWSASTSVIDSQAQTLTETTKKLEKAVKSVQDSQAAKQLNDVKSAAQAKADEANQLYQSSDGKVADNQTRDQLKTTLDALTATLQDAKTTVESVNTALTTLQQAIDAVNASMQAKTEADNAAAAAAAQQQAAAQAQAQQAQRSQRSTSRGQTQQRNTNRGGTSSPQRSQQTAPRSSTPAPSNNSSSSSSGNFGGYSSWEEFVNRPDESPCAKTNNCNLAVG